MTTTVQPARKDRESRYQAIKDICLYKNDDRHILLTIKLNKIKKTYCFVTPAQTGKGHHSRLSFETYEMALAVALKTLKSQSVNLSDISIEQSTTKIFIDEEIKKILEAEGIDVAKCKGIAIEEQQHQPTVTIAPPPPPKQQTPQTTIIKRPSIEELAASMRQLSERI